MVKVAVGIMAYNEEQNIGRLLSKLTGLTCIVVASGCTDRTAEIARGMGVKVIEQAARKGKANAINVFLEEVRSDILMLCSADVLPADFCLKYLLEPFNDKTVGMVGAHPIPIDSLHTTMGRVVHLLWNTHHRVALSHPKMGELCAFRNVITGIDPLTPVDEANIEQLLIEQGYKLVYAPRAIVFNKGPGTVEDFMRQRSRIYIGHSELKSRGYTVSTANTFRVLSAAPKNDLPTLARLCLLEYKARRLANKQQYLPTVWDVCSTTKKLA